MTVRRIKKPRANGQHVYRWVADVEWCHPDGRRERIRKMPRIQSRVAAVRLERELLAQLEKSSTRTASPTKLVPKMVDFWSEYWANHVVINNRPSERQAKLGIMKHHLLPAFGHLRLDQISLKAVEVYKATKLRPPNVYAPKTVNNHLAVLRSILRMAESWGEIVKAIHFRDVKVPAISATFLTPEESTRLVSCTEDKWRNLVILALNTGLRIGELLALRWEDITWSTEKISVCRSDWKGIIGPPKGGKPRDVPLNHIACKILRAHQHQRSSLIFCTSKGQRITQAMCRRPLHRACAKAGLAAFQWHTLRHTFASQLVTCGVSLRAIQALLGHASYATTERYAHLAPTVGRSAVNLLCGTHETPSSELMD